MHHITETINMVVKLCSLKKIIPYINNKNKNPLTIKQFIKMSRSFIQLFPYQYRKNKVH